ncbi:MAG TPA: DUF948 domain-containing protein [Mycobacteriales bacterium]|nr:DUF948 domain-containing protein [Mycobacteriales bacterium]
MSGGEIAALVAAGAFVLLVLLLAVPILKLGRTLDETTLAVRKAHEGAQPLLLNAQTTVEQVNRELARVEGITQNAQAMTSNAAALSSVFATTLGGPAIKVAAFSYGIRRAAQNRRRVEAERTAKDAARAGRRARRAARRAGI